MRKILLAGLVFLSTFGFGQSNLLEVDNQSKAIPDSLSGYADIAYYLTKDLKSDREKARAIYVWIAHNIKYDLTLVSTSRQYGSTQEIIEEVLKNRQGVCQHYSELFLAMGHSVGLKVYLIGGYTREVFGGIADFSHAWNGIRVGADFYLIDVTWAAGHELNGKYIHKFDDNYFLKSPRAFIKDHMPFDPIWQFLDNPIDHDDFVSEDFSKLDTIGDFSFADSIEHHQQLDELAQLEHSTRRMTACGAKNRLVQKQLSENGRQITHRRYNLAIDTLNYGINSYNLYVTHKNRQFRNPKLDDARIRALIDQAGQGIYAANDLFHKLSSSDSELKALIDDARNRMPSLIAGLAREKDFVDRYLRKWKPLRIFVF